jgi:hypothetical protein
MTAKPRGSAVGAGHWSKEAAKSSRGTNPTADRSCWRTTARRTRMGRGIYISLGGLILIIIVLLIVF